MLIFFLTCTIYEDPITEIDWSKNTFSSSIKNQFCRFSKWFYHIGIISVALMFYVYLGGTQSRLSFVICTIFQQSNALNKNNVDRNHTEPYTHFLLGKCFKVLLFSIDEIILIPFSMYWINNICGFNFGILQRLTIVPPLELFLRC